jgi:hypothetical protein
MVYTPMDRGSRARARAIVLRGRSHSTTTHHYTHYLHRYQGPTTQLTLDISQLLWYNPPCQVNYGERLEMTTRLYFTRQFTSGTLKGIRHYDSISFPTPKACMEWAESVNASSRLNYKIVDRSFQSYKREGHRV